jgi:hypothetical protein
MLLLRPVARLLQLEEEAVAEVVGETVAEVVGELVLGVRYVKNS